MKICNVDCFKSVVFYKFYINIFCKTEFCHYLCCFLYEFHKSSYFLGSLFESGELIVRTRPWSRTDSDGRDHPVRIDRIVVKSRVGSGEFSVPVVVVVLGCSLLFMLLFDVVVWFCCCYARCFLFLVVMSMLLYRQLIVLLASRHVLPT